MKIVICDYKDSMMPTHDYESKILNEGIENADIRIYEYKDEKRDEFLDFIEDANVILTGFVRIDKDVFERAKNLICVSINATGYDNVDLAEATKHSVAVFPVGEYCTKDVAEHTMALMLSLNKNLKHYTSDIEKRHIWKYDSATAPTRIENQTLGIFGLGKIGKRVARLAQGLGMNVIATDPYVSKEQGEAIGVRMVEPDEIYEEADIITNHMNLESSNTEYFTMKEFSKMKKSPIFLNLGRGMSINESDLAKALDENLIRAVGVDVLHDETPKLEGHILAGRDNVIITPHSAFYSKESMEDLQRISCQNIVYYLRGEKDKVFKLVNEI